jgi:hypothetical protein
MAPITRKQMPNYVSLKVCDELYELIAKESDKKQVPMIDVVVQALAEHFDRPDLAYVPRKPQGRKRVKHPA